MFLLNQIVSRPKVKKVIYLTMIIGLNFNLTSCSFPNLSNIFNSTKLIPINAIATKQKYKTVYITGTVIKIAPLLGSNAYQVQDNTGNIWVITAKDLPSVGQKIFIKCNIKSKNLALDNKELDELYLMELERIEKQ